jgi:adenylyltransferase/sulfurtransferase
MKMYSLKINHFHFELIFHISTFTCPLILLCCLEGAMAEHASRVQSLESQIASLESQLQNLRNELKTARRDASTPRSPSSSGSRNHQNPFFSPPSTNTGRASDYAVGTAAFYSAYGSEILSALAPSEEPEDKYPLEREEYKRYGRQLIMPEIGLAGQLRLKKARVLVVGVGGLGCPASMYLAGAGVGTLGLVDGDTVEMSNLHRQVLHNEGTVGWSKVDSAVEGLRKYVVCFPSVLSVCVESTINADSCTTRLNPLVDYKPYNMQLAPEHSLELFAQYDVVLDCTDNPATRYLISDTCVLLGKPLVSASALKTEGQLMLLNYPARPAGDPAGGPCYRCVFPKPPPADSIVSCGDGGVVGPVVGVMGILQALEVIKVITAEDTSSNPSISSFTAAATASFSKSSLSPPSLLLFSGYSTPPFRSIKLRSRSSRCAVCSSQAIITPDALLSGSMDYIQFCGVTNPINLLSADERVTAKDYAEARKSISMSERQHRIIDVREKVQFDLCHLFGSINIPFSRLNALDPHSVDHDTLEMIDDVKSVIGVGSTDPVLVVCRLGNDSQIAVRKFKELGLDENGKIWVGDVKGGLKAWREDVDPTFPDY